MILYLLDRLVRLIFILLSIVCSLMICLLFSPREIETVSYYFCNKYQWKDFFCEKFEYWFRTWAFQ